MPPRSEIFTSRNCYEILPQSFKMIVFDTTLLLKKALAVLVQHGVQSAPVWDSQAQKFIGMLTGICY
jgi:5'-AMP-activated protein kinase, regulatory gamma subunit